MSTRATVWIKSEKEGRDVFLYHHCDGYCLDEDIDPVLKNLPCDEAWNVEDIKASIMALEFGDSYREVDTVGWDSEYVYKISVDERKMYKYDTGIGDPDGKENFESRLTDLVKTYEYTVKREEFDAATQRQILHIQLLEFLKYTCKWIDFEPIPPREIERIQKLFKILNEE